MVNDMVEIRETSYNDERLGFFADQRKLVQKRYDRLEKQIKPDEPYTSERREFLSDLGRELSFYNDIIEMLENGVVPKSEHDKALAKWADDYAENTEKWERAYEDLEIDFENAKTNGAKEIFREIVKRLPCDSDFNSQDIRFGYAWALTEVRRMLHEIKKEYNIED